MNISWQEFIHGDFSWKRLLLIPLIFYGLFFLFAVFFSEKLIFPYRGCSYNKDLPGFDYMMTNDSQKIATCFRPAKNEKFLLLYFHGNGEDLGHLAPLFDHLNHEGFSILSMDYRGYGLSSGEPTEKNCYADAQQLYEKALSLGYQPEKIILWGRSVGSGPATHLAWQKEAHALVLESPFVTAFRVLTRIPILPFDRFNNLEKMSATNIPLFIIHGDRDTLIPPWHCKKLYDQHPGRKERHLIPGAGHNDLWAHDLTDILQKLQLFIQPQSH